LGEGWGSRREGKSAKRRAAKGVSGFLNQECGFWGFWARRGGGRATPVLPPVLPSCPPPCPPCAGGGRSGGNFKVQISDLRGRGIAKKREGKTRRTHAKGEKVRETCESVRFCAISGKLGNLCPSGEEGGNTETQRHRGKREKGETRAGRRRHGGTLTALGVRGHLARAECPCLTRCCYPLVKEHASVTDCAPASGLPLSEHSSQENNLKSTHYFWDIWFSDRAGTGGPAVRPLCGERRESRGTRMT
jgi:hypothetical protein